MSEKSVLYVCVMSKHNLPELECCISLKPAYLLPVISNNEHIKKAAERFESQVKLHLPETEFINTNSQSISLVGDGLEECHNWVINVLKPVLESNVYRDCKKVLNITGGTKALALPLSQVINWDLIEYKAIGHNQIQRHHPTSNQFESQPLPCISVESAVALYSECHKEHSVTGFSEASYNTRWKTTVRLWEALSEKEEGLAALFSVLTKIWSIGRREHQQDNIPCLWREVAETQVIKNKVLKWLSVFNTLSPSSFIDDGDYLVVPGNKIKSSEIKALKKWISGDWLEELLYGWLIEAGLDRQQVSLNIRSGQKKQSASQREADLLVLNNGQICVVEVKADIPAHLEAKNIEEQISSLGDRFGEIKKVIFLGPEATDRLTKGNKIEDFRLRCKSNHVIVCTSKEEFLKVI